MTDQPPPPPAEPISDDEISLLDLAIVLAKHKKLVLGLPFAAAVVAAIVSLLMTPIFTATTRILPPQQNQSAASAILTQLDNVAGLSGALPSLKNPSDLYVGMLKSRTVADNLIQRFDLNKVYGQELQSETRKRLERATKISAGRDGIIVVDVDDEDPKRATALANGYVEELLNLTNVLAVTAASQRRLFFERQFAQTKENLYKAETAARAALEQGGLANIDAQSRAILETTAVLRAQIAAKEVEIHAMRTFATDRNPDLVRARDSLAAMRRELGRIEGATQGMPKGKDAAHSLGLENVRLLREVKYNETLYGLLAKQYELARIDEASDAGIVQVLDKAVEPDRRSKPNRKLIVIVTALAFGFLAVIVAFVREFLERSRQDPQSSERLEALKKHLRWR